MNKEMLPTERMLKENQAKLAWMWGRKMTLEVNLKRPLFKDDTTGIFNTKDVDDMFSKMKFEGGPEIQFHKEIVIPNVKKYLDMMKLPTFNGNAIVTVMDNFFEKTGLLGATQNIADIKLQDTIISVATTLDPITCVPEYVDGFVHEIIHIFLSYTPLQYYYMKTLDNQLLYEKFTDILAFIFCRNHTRQYDNYKPTLGYIGAKKLAKKDFADNFLAKRLNELKIANILV